MTMERSAIPHNVVLQGDCRTRLLELPDSCIHCVVTSPPYWGLRDYGIEPTIWGGDAFCGHVWTTSDQIKRYSPHSGLSAAADKAAPRVNLRNKNRAENGELTYTTSTGCICGHCGAWRGVYGLEPTRDLYMVHTVEIFRAVHRVLRDDGTLWLNLGDSYTSGGRDTHGTRIGYKQESNAGCLTVSALRPECPSNLKPKDLLGIPWWVAFALQADGWYLRQDIIWHKPSPMPESVTDRCTKAHEYLFLLTKSPHYFYDAEAIKEGVTGNAHGRGDGMNPKRLNGVQGVMRSNPTFTANELVSIRNKRSVWSIPSAPFKEAHFATFPPNLVRPCLRAGTSEKGCCPDCGAPWQRVTGASRAYRKFKRAERERKGCSMRVSSFDGYGLSRGTGNRTCAVENDTIGWRPTCACYAVPWAQRFDEVFAYLSARNRTRYGRKRHQQDLADSWCDRAKAYADQILMPREHGMFAAVPCLVLDPFGGAGTTGLVAAQERRDWLLIEAKPEYYAMAQRRIAKVVGAMAMPLFDSPENLAARRAAGAIRHRDCPPSEGGNLFK
jgi:DNA modification methylase